MDKLNLTDYERGFLVAKSQEMVVNAWQLMHGDDWYSVTVVYPMGNVKQNKEFDLNFWNDDDDNIFCYAYAIKDNGQTDGNTFERLW